MPVSLSGLAGAVTGAAGGRRSGVVVRGGRAYKLVPAGAKMQRRHRRSSGGKPDRMTKLLELAIIANMMRGSH